MAHLGKKPLWRELREFLRLPSLTRFTSSSELLSRWDELKAFDVQALMLNAALECEDEDSRISLVVKLVQQGAQMHEAAMACVGRLSSGNAWSKCDMQLQTLIAAADWAGRWPELHQHLESAMDLYPESVSALPAHVSQRYWPLSQLVDCRKASVETCGARLLRHLVLKLALTVDDQTLFRSLVQSGTPMGLATSAWLWLVFARRQVKQTNFYFMYKAACQAKRDLELLAHVDDARIADSVLKSIHERAHIGFFDDDSWAKMNIQSQKKEARAHLEILRINGLLGPCAAHLQSHLEGRCRALEHVLQFGCVEEDDFNPYDMLGEIPSDNELECELECVELCLGLLMEYAETDRWYALHLSKILGTHHLAMPPGPAHLIAAFAIAEQPELRGFRKVDEDSAAYTWEEFVEFYGSVTKARKPWLHAIPVTEQVCHDDLAPLFEPDLKDGPCASNARELGSDAIEDVEEPSSSIEKSLHAEEQGTDQLMRALQESKAVPAPLSSDGVVLLRLTRNARSPEVTALLLDPVGPLAGFHSRVIDAGCEVTPSWARGAKLYVPCTQPLFGELERSFEIHEHHILALSADKQQIERALQAIPRRNRPRLASELHSREDNEIDLMVVPEEAFFTDSSIGFPAGYGVAHEV